MDKHAVSNSKKRSLFDNEKEQCTDLCDTQADFTSLCGEKPVTLSAA